MDPLRSHGLFRIIFSRDSCRRAVYHVAKIETCHERQLGSVMLESQDYRASIRQAILSADANAKIIDPLILVFSHPAW